MELTFKQEKETKNTVRYQEQSDGDVVIGPLYVQKSALGENPPEELTLWLEISESEDADDEEPDESEDAGAEEVEETEELAEATA
jgi:hypothetical protein